MCFILFSITLFFTSPAFTPYLKIKYHQYSISLFLLFFFLWYQNVKIEENFHLPNITQQVNDLQNRLLNTTYQRLSPQGGFIRLLLLVFLLIFNVCFFFRFFFIPLFVLLMYVGDK